MFWSFTSSEFCSASSDAQQNPQRLPIFYPVFKDAPMLLSTARNTLPAVSTPRSLNCAGHSD
jgi:hypothetical protein